MSRLGAPSETAALVTDGLITACGWWHPGQGQGLEKLFRYARRVENGGIDPLAEMKWVSERPAAALLDAQKGFGYAAAQMGMTRAMEMARITGIATVGITHSNHFGIAGYHARTAASAGLIGIAMTNAGAEMAPWGSATPVLGTNPWGLAIPRPEPHDPIILDMALTQSGKGMMRWLARAGLPMPPHWALTPDGENTTDPAAADQGPLLPMGDYKGYGLSLFTDVLAGVMTGSLFGPDVFQDDENYDVGHVMIALDPTAYLDRSDFDSRLEQLIQAVLAAQPINPDVHVQLPGQMEQSRARDRMETGLPISNETLAGLQKLATDLDVPFTLTTETDHE